MNHWIQNHILLELTKHHNRRYSELRPADVEGNLFMYHLKGIIKEGLVEKHDASYRLTPKGVRFAAGMSLKTGKQRVQPIILSAVVCKNERNEYLFTRWHRQPNIDQVSFPHGMVHFGESIFDMARLELAEKAGLEADVTHLSDVYIRAVKEEIVERHWLVHVFMATNIRPGRQDERRTDVCDSFWSTLANVPRKSFMPGFYEIAEMAHHEAYPAFSELTVPL